jgi:DNA-binding CsgD family transcriptional regulator
MRKSPATTDPEVYAVPALLDGVGLLLVTSSGTVISANREAVRILGYTAALELQFKRTLKRALDIVFAPNGRNDQGWSTELVSGRRRYRCWGIALGLETQRLVAVLIERSNSTSGILPDWRDKYRLTPREQQTVTLLASGLTNKQIAGRMDVSANTVKAFIRAVMLKFGVTTRAGIVGRLSDGASALSHHRPVTQRN